MSYEYSYPRMQVTADVAVVTHTPQGSHVLLVERGNEPYKGKLCFPGGFADMKETLAEAASRELVEETGLIALPSDLEFVHLFDGVNRDPRDRTITALYRLHLKQRQLPEVVAGDDAAKVKWVHLYDALDMDAKEFGFDHYDMLRILYNRYYFEY